MLSACNYPVIKTRNVLPMKSVCFSAHEFVSATVYCGEELTLRV